MKKMLMAITIAGGLSIVPSGPVPGAEVPINPITPEIRDRLKESTELVGSVEDTMAPKVTDLETIYKTFNETCKGKDGDRGCVEIQNQLRQKYRDVLETMVGNLPEVRKSISTTARELGGSIKKKTMRKDVKELYKGLVEKGAPPKVRGPLSKKLSELLRAMGTARQNVSILELSLRTQADMIAASEMLDYLEAQVSSQLAVLDITTDLGVLSPEMASVMRGVAELFGYDVEFGPEDMVPTAGGGDYEGDDWRD